MEILENQKALKNFCSKVEKKETCWIWNAHLNKGYGKFGVNGTMKSAHRVSFELHNKRLIGEGMFILHSCDNPKCVNPFHLSEGTHQENMTDKVNKNRQMKGTSHWNSNLTEELVIEIRNKYSLGNFTQKQLGLEYNINYTLINKIIKRKLWKHI